MTKIQMALDSTKLEDLIKIVKEVHDLIDIVEIGTPFLLRSGLEPVRQVKAAFPSLDVLTDGKIIDGAKMETEDQARAGADYVTVMAHSDDSTVRQVVETAYQEGSGKIKVVADLLQVQNLENRANDLLNLGVDYLAVHTGVDQQAQGRTPLADLKKLTGFVDSSKIAVAGGINLANIKSYIEEKPGIIIVGSALTQSKTKRQDLQTMRQLLAQ